jgi:hypothetical protein
MESPESASFWPLVVREASVSHRHRPWSTSLAPYPSDLSPRQKGDPFDRQARGSGNLAFSSSDLVGQGCVHDLQH